MITDRLRALPVLLVLTAAAVVGLAGPAAADSGLCNGGQGAFGPSGYVLTTGPKGTTSAPGAPFTLATQVTSSGKPVSGFCVDVVQNAGPSTGWPRSAVTDAQGVASLTWTSAAEGIDSVTAEYRDSRSGQVVGDTARHTWAKATPSPQPSVTRSPTPKPTPPPSPTPAPTRSPTPSPVPSPTIPPSSSASPSGSPSPTRSPSPTPSTSPSGTPSSSPPGPTGSPSPSSGPETIHLDTPSALPGGSASLTGDSCPPGSAVTFSVEGAAAGATTAKPDGTFEGTVQLPDTSIGAHVIQATCGGRTASAPIDLVVSSSSSAPSAAGAAVAAVFLFFLLLGSVLFARNHGRERAGEPE